MYTLMRVLYCMIHQGIGCSVRVERVDWFRCDEIINICMYVIKVYMNTWTCEHASMNMRLVTSGPMEWSARKASLTRCSLSIAIPVSSSASNWLGVITCALHTYIHTNIHTYIHSFIHILRSWWHRYIIGIQWKNICVTSCWWLSTLYIHTYIHMSK